MRLHLKKGECIILLDNNPNLVVSDLAVGRIFEVS